MQTLSLDTFVSIATILSVLLGGASLVYAINIYKRQMEAQLLQTYTTRHDDVMQALHRRPNGVHFNVFEEPPPESADLTLEVLRYLNLCSEEFYLNERGYLSRGVWDIWRSEIQDKLASRLIKREWVRLGGEFKTHSAFHTYVNRVVAVDRAAPPVKQRTSGVAPNRE